MVVQDALVTCQTFMYIFLALATFPLASWRRWLVDTLELGLDAVGTLGHRAVAFDLLAHTGLTVEADWGQRAGFTGAIVGVKREMLCRGGGKWDKIPCILH